MTERCPADEMQHLLHGSHWLVTLTWSSFFLTRLFSANSVINNIEFMFKQKKNGVDFIKQKAGEKGRPARYNGQLTEQKI